MRRYLKLLINTDDDWRASLLQMLLVTFSVISLPILANEIIYREDWVVPVLAFCVLPGLAALKTRLPYTVRATVLVCALMLFGIWASYTAGLMGGGRTLMGSATILGAVLLGGRVGVGLFLTGIAASTAIAYAAVTGGHVFPHPFDQTPNTTGLWASHIGTFVIASGVLLLSIRYVINALERVHIELKNEMRERQAVEASERETARHLNFLVSNITDVIWTADLDLNATYITDSVRRLRGFTPEEVRKMDVGDVIATGSPEFAKEMLAAELEKDPTADPNRSVRVDTRVSTKDGRGVDVEISVKFIRDDAGKPVGLLGVTRDISDRKRLESAMDSVIRGTKPTGEADFFEALTANLADVLDANTVMVGTLIDESTVQCIAVHRSGIQVPAFSYRLAKPAGARNADDGEPHLIPDEALLSELGVQSYIGIPLVDEQNSIIGLLAALDDKPFTDRQLTKDLLTIFAAHASLELSRKRSEAERQEISLQLRQSQKLESIGQLSGGIAHDFNNQLVVIQGFAELAEEQAAGNQELLESLRNVREGTERAASLTRQLLSFSRRQVIDLRVTNLNKLLVALSSMLSRLLPENIEFQLDTSGDIGAINADPRQLEQAIINLAVNARDAMPDGGTLRISTSAEVLGEDAARAQKPGPHVVLGVSDTGHGIDSEIREQIFEPFFTTKPEGAGTGLGLSVVFGIVNQHGGFVDVQSNPDTGTVFRLYFPAIDGLAEATPSSSPAPLKQGKETILLVEDEPAVRKLASIFLEKAGYRVVEAEDGDQAIEQFRAHRDEIELALLDVVLPGANGREVVERITSDSPALKIIFTSGYAADGIHTNFILEDDLILLPKPYNRDQLLGKVREVLDG